MRVKKDCFLVLNCYNPCVSTTMASLSPDKFRLKVQVAKLAPEKDPAFYIVPPLLVAALFAFCAYVPRAVLNFKHPFAPKYVAASKPRVDLPDPNINLPLFAIPSGSENLLKGAQRVSVSAEDKEAPARNAVNGSCEDDANVAVALPAGKTPAWWQVEIPAGVMGEELVIYGGGSQSPAGKLIGGFSVEIEYSGGQTVSREFCREGFALEGHETWKLDAAQSVRRIRVSALRPDTPIVLREVQLIGAGQH